MTTELNIHQEYYNDTLKLNPLSATFAGDHRFDGEYINCFTEEYRIKSINLINKYTPHIKQFEPFSDLIKYTLDKEKKFLSLSFYYLPVNHLENPFQELLDVVPYSNLPNSLIYYKKRIIKMINTLPELQMNMIHGINAGIVSNKKCISILITKLRTLKLPKVNKEFTKFMKNNFIPEAHKFADFLNKYLPFTKESLGLYGLNYSLYKFCISNETDTNYNPETIHKLGLSLVHSINKMKSIHNSNLKKESNIFKTSKEAVDAYTSKFYELRDISGIQIKLPKITVINEPYEAAFTYWEPTLDGKNPGILKLNSRDISKHGMYKSDVLNLTAHELYGHGYQLPTIILNKSLPKWVRTTSFTSVSEGFALYMETLFKGTSLENYSSLNSLQLRAVRLVIDTGIHYKGWSFDKCYNYMKKYLYLPDEEITAEIYRYSVLPGQALSYMIGCNIIIKMRKKWEGTTEEFVRWFVSVSYLPICLIKQLI